MKIGVFSDAHYCHAEVLCNTRRPSLSLAKIREAMDAFRLAGVDVCICLGDLTDHAPADTKEEVVSCFHEILRLIHSNNMPFYFVPGNHDYLMMTADEPCIVCVHENLDPLVEHHHIVKNSDIIRRIIQESGKVKLVLQGHYHPGAERMIDGIPYMTLPAMCEGADNSYRVLTLP